MWQSKNRLTDSNLYVNIITYINILKWGGIIVNYYLFYSEYMDDTYGQPEVCICADSKEEAEDTAQEMFGYVKYKKEITRAYAIKNALVVFWDIITIFHK